VFWSYVLGQYLGGIDEIHDDAPRELLPLDHFDDDRLKRHTTLVTEEEADLRAASMTRETRAGLKPAFGCTGRQLRRAIRLGALAPTERGIWKSTLGGICLAHRWVLYARWRLSIYELARITAVEFNGESTLSVWLNLWAENASRPLPDGDGLSREDRARRRGFAMKGDHLYDATTGEPIELTPGPWSLE
jgi:hypothetical protein